MLLIYVQGKNIVHLATETLLTETQKFKFQKKNCLTNYNTGLKIKATT